MKFGKTVCRRGDGVYGIDGILVATLAVAPDPIAPPLAPGYYIVNATVILVR